MLQSVPLLSRVAFAASLAAAVGPPLARANQIGVPLLQTYSMSDLQDSPAAYSISQGPDGIMYFGGPGVVLTFDGDRWKKDSLALGSMFQGLEFSADRSKQWVISTNSLGWFETLPNGTRSYHSLVSHLPEPLRSFGNGWFAKPIDNGAIFVTESRVFRWNGQAFRSWAFSSPSRAGLFRCGDALYLDDGEKGIYRYLDDDFKILIPESKLAGARLLWLKDTPAGLLLLTKQGFKLWDGTALHPVNPESSAILRSTPVPTIAISLPGNRVAVGTARDGILIFDQGGRFLKWLTKSSTGIPTNSVFCLFVDRENGLWVSSPDFIYRLDLPSDAYFFDRDLSPAIEPFTSSASNGGITYLVNSSQVFMMTGNPPEIHDLPIPGLEQTSVLRNPSLLGNDRVAIGTEHGLAVLGKGQPHLFYTASHSNAISCTVASNEPNHLYAALVGSKIADIDVITGESRDIPTPGISNTFDLGVDALGRLWFESYPTGFFFLEQPNSTSPVLHSGSALFPKLGGPGTEDMTIRQSPDHTLFFLNKQRAFILPKSADRLIPVPSWPKRSVDTPVAASSAISSFNSRSVLWAVFPAANGAPSTAGNLSIDDSGATWHPHSIPGLWKIGYPYGISQIEGTTTDTLIVMGSKGTLWVNVPENETPVAPVPPIVHVLAQIGNDSAYGPVSGPLPYSTRKVLIEASAPTFRWRPALLIQTMVDGVDNDWLSLDSTSRRELTGLRDGSYSAHVRTLSDSGIPSQELTIAFVILPPWWMTRPFAIAAAAALMAAIVAGYRFRVRKIREKAFHLEETVARRTVQLTNARTQAEKANSAKTDFIARISHNIRNPLNGIVGISLALTDTKLKAGQVELVETLDSCARQLTTLIDDVLDFSRIETGKVDLRPTACSLRSVLRAITTSLATQAASTNSQIEMHVGPELPDFIMVDARRLEEILLNFMTNAIRYAPGHIVLRADKALDAPDTLECSVQDRGPGFSQEDQEVLFTSFTQLNHPAQGAPRTGTGLGLALCRSLASLMGGTVGVKSVAGFGSRFFVRLPLIPAAPPTGDAKHFSAGLRFAKALIVEDADYNAWAFAAVLAHTGVRASDRAKDGREAIELFKSSVYDVVLLDRNLPDMDGTVVARTLRGLEDGLGHTLIICVSAYSTTEDRDQCLGAGMDFFAGKPLTPERLSAIFLEASMDLQPTSPSDMPETDPPKPAEGFSSSMRFLQELARLAGTPLSAQIEHLVILLNASIDQLRAAVAQGDFDAIRLAAHEIIGHAQLVDAKDLEALASSARLDAVDGDITEIPQLVEQINDEAVSLVAALRQHGGRASPRA